jgi:hypothetical protein
VRVWADPFSLATTQGVEVSFLSSGYLDVSVPQLASSHPMDSGTGTAALPAVSFLIRKSRDQRMVSSSPGLIAAAHVLLRLLVPRHPPCALVLLIRRTPVLWMSLWSFQGPRGLAPALREATGRQRAGLSKLNSVRTPRSTLFQASRLARRRQASRGLMPSKGFGAHRSTRAPVSLERR